MSIRSCGKVFAMFVMSLPLGSIAKGAMMDDRSVWMPGWQYETTVKYQFGISNGVLKLPSTKDKPYLADGEFSFPYIAFNPVVRFLTGDVSRDGQNYYARRTYERPEHWCYGGKNIEWKSTCKWYKKLYGVHWINKLRLGWDKDLEELKRMQNGGDVSVCEDFPVFGWKNDVAPFDCEQEALYLKWTGDSLVNLLTEEENDLVVRIGKKDSDAKDGRHCGAAPDVVRDTIRSEWNLSASSLFAEDGCSAISRKSKKKWEINAEKLHGLLASEQLRQLVRFSGTLEARMRKVPLEELQSMGVFTNSPFDAVCIEVTGSKNFKLGFDTGSGYETFGVMVGKEKECEGQMEFWFDVANEILRYAKVEIRKKNYQGSLPNPGLGKMISQLKGKVNGELEFVCEYNTEIRPTLNPERVAK